DQGFPLPWDQAGGLLRVEAYRIDLSGLVVHGDDPGAPAPSHRNVGTGHSRGIDTLLAARAGRLQGTLTWSLLETRRNNPLNDRFEREVAPPQDQRHTLGAMVEAQLTGR